MRLALLAIGTFCLFATPVLADDCRAQISSFAPTVANPDNNKNVALAYVTSTNNVGTVSYSKASLNYGSATIPNGPVIQSLTNEHADQTFNDRDNFNPAKKDDLGIRIQSGRVTFTLHTWKEGKIAFTPTCRGRFMYGGTDDGNGQFIILLLPPEKLL